MFFWVFELKFEYKIVLIIIKYLLLDNKCWYIDCQVKCMLLVFYIFNVNNGKKQVE